MQKLIIVGNLTRDPDSRTTTAGKQVCSFHVAVNRRPKIEGQPDADFFRVTTFGALADNCARYLVKGKKVCVTGKVSVSQYKTNSGEYKASMEVFAEDVEFLAGGEKTQQNAQETAKTDKESGFVEVKEELPF
jgi:single-strand DNA-binding protein